MLIDFRSYPILHHRELEAQAASRRFWLLRRPFPSDPRARISGRPLIFLSSRNRFSRNMVRLKYPVTHRKQTMGLGFNRNTFGGSRFRFFPLFLRVDAVRG